MARFKNDKGLTLIELLITISVLAVVSAIALPVINNVVSASNSNALQQTIKDADAFINKYSKSGVVAYDGLTRTFQGYVDTDGDNTIDSNELIDTLTLDGKFAATANGTSPSIGGSYSNGGVTGATITAAGGSTGGPSTAPLLQTTAKIYYDWDISQWEMVITELGTVQVGDTIVVTADAVNAGAINPNISGTYTVTSAITKNETIGWDQALQQPILGDQVHIKLDSTFNNAFQGASGMWASSWYPGVSISVTR